MKLVEKLDFSPGDLVVADSYAPQYLPRHATVGAAELSQLDPLHAEVHAKPPARLVGLGGPAAVNAAKVLSVRRARRGGLRTSLFERPFPSIPVMLAPLKPAFCTDTTPLTVIFDRQVPVYYVLFLKPESVLVLRRALEERAGEAGWYLPGLLPASAGLQSYMDYCARNWEKGLSLEFILSLTVAALTGIGVEDSLHLVAQALRGELVRGEKVLTLARALRRRIDHFVEHAWSFYRKFLMGFGVGSPGDLYGIFRLIESSL